MTRDNVGAEPFVKPGIANRKLKHPSPHKPLDNPQQEVSVSQGNPESNKMTLLLIFAVAFLAWSNGANDNFKG
ncbi:MAG TPA: hypothetical protein VK968_18725, partial [Roseimicrobium sp.]|nr:hypothetical protein [Roseimicrobium sp.]